MVTSSPKAPYHSIYLGAAHSRTLFNPVEIYDQVERGDTHYSSEKPIPIGLPS